MNLPYSKTFSRRPKKILNRHAPGFTLVELLTAMAIISILGGLLFAAIGNVRQTANQTTCVNNMRQLGTATMLYVQDHNGKYPLSNEEASWDKRIMPYLDHPSAENPCEVLKCPSDERDLTISENNFARSYAASAPHRDMSSGEVDKRGMIRNDFSRTLFELSNPADTVFLTEWFSTSEGEIIAGQRQFKPAYAWITGWYGGESSQNWPVLEDGQCYHGSTMNFCFADGHVESLRPWEVNDPKNRWLAVR